MGPTTVKALLLASVLEQAQRYRKQESLRAAILNRVRESMTGRDRWVVIGHSLGSVVALDLITHLPDEVEIAALVTVASPLSRSVLRDHLKDQRERFPYDRVQRWINVYNSGDLVPGGRGVSDAFPEAIDVAISGRFHDHDAVVCLTAPSVAEVLAIGVFGSQSREIAKRVTETERPWDNVEIIEAAGLQLSYRTEEYLQVRGAQTSLGRYSTARAFVTSAIEESWRERQRPPVIDDPRADLSSQTRRTSRAS